MLLPMLCRFDLHCHTHFSADGVSPPEALVEEARRKGLQGFALTDHNTCNAVTYLERKGLIRSDGLPVDGLLLIPGVEVSTADGHLLCLGCRLDEMIGARASEVCKAAHAAGGIAIPAHPYDGFRSGIREKTLDTLDVDAIEVFNSASTLKLYNERAEEYAARRSLPMTASSDSHHFASLGTATTELELESPDLASVLQAIREGRTTLHKRYLSNRDAFIKTCYNWFRLRKRPGL